MAENIERNHLRVAIYLPDSDWLIPETGGTFSVTNNFIIELDKRIGLKDKFVLLVDNDREVQLLKNRIRNLDIISLNRPVTKVKKINIGYKQRIKYRIKNELKKYIDQPLKSPIKKSYVSHDPSFDKFLLNFVNENRIGIIYYPIQHKCLSVTVPFVVTNWDIAHKSTFYFPEIAKIIDLREDWYQNILPKALAVFCESEAGKKELQKYYQIVDNKIRIQPLIPGPVIDCNLEKDKQLEILNDLGLERKKYFFYPAQFWVLKNHKTLVDAFHLLSKEYKGLKLVLTGSDKGNQQYIKEICNSLNIHSSVIMPGFVDDDQLYALYKNAIAMVMPTLLGPTNMPILEAMAIDCPVLCSDIEGHIEILGNNNQVFSAFNKSEIKSKMEKCFVEKDFREELLKFQRKRYNKSTFNRDSTVNHLLNNFEEVMKVRELWG